MTTVDLWQLPHIQELVAATRQDDEEGGTFIGYKSDGTAIYRHAVDDLFASWKQKQWQIELGTSTFKGRFDRMESMDAAYIEYLDHNEVFAPLTLVVSLEEPVTLFEVPIEAANVAIQDAQGWPAHLSIQKHELFITAHPAAFRVCDQNLL